MYTRFSSLLVYFFWELPAGGAGRAAAGSADRSIAPQRLSPPSASLTHFIKNFTNSAFLVYFCHFLHIYDHVIFNILNFS